MLKAGFAKYDTSATLPNPVVYEKPIMTNNAIAFSSYNIQSAFSPVSASAVYVSGNMNGITAWGYNRYANNWVDISFGTAVPFTGYTQRNRYPSAFNNKTSDAATIDNLADGDYSLTLTTQSTYSNATTNDSLYSYLGTFNFTMTGYAP